MGNEQLEITEQITPKQLSSAMDKDRAIEGFYLRRHFSRGKVGRLTVRVFDTDRPRYF